jgi:hypothetical protein
MNTTLTTTLSLALLAVPAAASDDAVSIRAWLEPGPLEVGAAGAFIVELEYSDGVHASEAGIPAPFLQLDVPEGMRLSERHLTDLKDLAKNEYLQAPYERLMSDPYVRVPFELDAAPAADATLGILVSGYVTTVDDAFYLRERLELPLREGAQAEPGDDRDSSWGTDTTLLAIGDQVPDFSLPGVGDERVTLSEELQRGHVLLTTYRAFW